MSDPCAILNSAITVDDYISATEQMMEIYGTTTNVRIEASHNNVEFMINGASIDSLQDFGGSLIRLHEIFIGLRILHENAVVSVESGYNTSFWMMEE